MNWARMLAYITGTVDQELLLRNEYLAAENRILRAQIKGRLLLSDAEKATLAEIAHRWDATRWRNWRLSPDRIRCWPGTENSSPRRTPRRGGGVGVRTGHCGSDRKFLSALGVGADRAMWGGVLSSFVYTV